MKFLIKIEEALDKLILAAAGKMQAMVPQFVYKAIDSLKSLPKTLLALALKKNSKLRIIILKIIGYSQHYFTLLRGKIVGFFIYLRSDEFKQVDKKTILLKPFKLLKEKPLALVGCLVLTVFLGGVFSVIYKNTEKIIAGTKALRAPASVAIEEEPIVEFKQLEYKTLDNLDVILDIDIITHDNKQKKELYELHKEVKKHLLELPLHIPTLPLEAKDLAQIKKTIIENIDGERIKSVEVRQILKDRPEYYLQKQKLSSFKDISLQIFLEDTKRNRQVWIDFTLLSDNRNVTLFLLKSEVEVKDYLNMYVEPVIPQLPLDDEGRQIIKDKIQLEMNNLLKKHGLEGEILEVYLDYILVS